MKIFHVQNSHTGRVCIACSLWSIGYGPLAKVNSYYKCEGYVIPFYRDIMKYDGPGPGGPGPNQETEKQTLELRWGGDGYCLLTLISSDSEIDDKPQAIIIWENPDNCTKPRVRSIMNLEQYVDKAYFMCMRCNRSNIILGGLNVEHNGPTNKGVVSIVSLSTGQAEAIIRKRFISIIV